MDTPALENRLSEAESRVQDSATAINERDRAVENWIEHKVPWNKLYNKRE